MQQRPCSPPTRKYFAKIYISCSSTYRTRYTKCSCPLCVQFKSNWATRTLNLGGGTKTPLPFDRGWASHVVPLLEITCVIKIPARGHRHKGLDMFMHAALQTRATVPTVSFQRISEFQTLMVDENKVHLRCLRELVQIYGTVKNKRGKWRCV